MNIKRLRQVIEYGCLHAGDITEAEKKNIFFKIKIFFDILYSFYHYKMWSNQYKKEKFYLLTSDEKKILGSKYREEGIKRDEWQKDFILNRKFLIKYSNIKYELSPFREIRNREYAKRFNTGKNLMVEYDVNISRQHYLPGTISIGNNVLLAKHVFIDYSGFVTIKDNVQLTNGVIVETHHHPFHSDWRKNREITEQSKLVIEEGAVIGSKAIIMPTCNYIGKYARVGAGAVVTKDIPDYAVAVGVPAKVVRIVEP